MKIRRWLVNWGVRLLLFTFVSLVWAGPALAGDNVHLGIRISSMITEEQLGFVNTRFDFVLTEYLGDDVRAMVHGPRLFLYRSIQDTWPGFHQFDWNHINACENMFCHHRGERIRTIFNSWLMDGADLVDSSAPDAMNHWINYYAVTASNQVYSYHYDGLFIDCASHRLWPGVVRGQMPDGYSDDDWRDTRYADLAFIKGYFPDKPVVFNGLHSGNGAERSLNLTDGGMWETFAFRIGDGAYYGEEKWRKVIDLAESYGAEKYICIVSKKAGFTSDIASRMFVFASYLLVSRPKVVLYISDLSYGTKAIMYYPEYEIDLGAPTGSFIVRNGIYERRFEKGRVLVNPSFGVTKIYALDVPCRQVVPVGGGPIGVDGAWSGRLIYQPVSGQVVLPPVTGMILMEQ